MFRGLGLDVVETKVDQVKVSAFTPAYKGPAVVETDLWVPVGEVAVLLEVTESGADGVADKLKKLRNTLMYLRTGLSACGASVAKRRVFWGVVGIPKARLPKFDKVKSIACTIFAEGMANPPTRQPGDPQILSEQDCRRLADYGRVVGTFGQLTAAAALGAELPPESKEIIVDLCDSASARAEQRLVGLPPEVRADAYLFFVDPYDILKYSRVPRLEWLAQAFDEGDQAYQRPLDPSKVRRIRRELLEYGGEVLLPGSILAFLHQKTEVKSDSLHIPSVAGALEVIDGQHRLFAYANHGIEKAHKGLAKLAVLALHFPGVSQDRVLRTAGQMFVDINDKQKRVPAAHLDQVGWPVLKIRQPRYIAANVLSRINARTGKPTSGLFFRTIASPTPIRPTTVRSAIQIGFPPQRLCGKKLNGKGKPASDAVHLLKLLNVDEGKLLTPDAYIDAVSALVAKFLDALLMACPADLQALQKGEQTSMLGLSKGMAGVIRGLCLCSEANAALPPAKRRDLAKDLLALPNDLVTNVRSLSAIVDPTALVFSLMNAKLPTAKAKQGEFAEFIRDNLTTPTAFVPK